MVIFLYGPDVHRLKKESDSVVSKYKEKHPNGFNFFSISLQDDGLKKLEDTIKTVSFFEEIKLILLRGVTANKANAEALGELIKEQDLIKNKAIVLLVSENLSEKDFKTKNPGLFAILADKNNLVRNFENLDGKKLENWIIKEFGERGCSMSPSTAKMLIDVVGKDTPRLISEIQKLSNFKIKGEIKPDDIRTLVVGDVETNIFNFLDAITARNKVKAIELLYKELKTGHDGHYLLTMLVYQLRNSLIVKDLLSRKLTPSEVAKKAKIHPFVVSKLSKSLGQTTQDLEAKFRSLAQIEILSKQGRLDVEESLYNFVLNC